MKRFESCTILLKSYAQMDLEMIDQSIVVNPKYGDKILGHSKIYAK